MLTLPQLNKYLKLDQKGKIMAEYVWIDATGETRSKSRVSSGLAHIFPYLDPGPRQLHLGMQAAVAADLSRLPRHTRAKGKRICSRRVRESIMTPHGRLVWLVSETSGIIRGASV